jgi:hypothetical protein
MRRLPLTGCSLLQKATCTICLQLPILHFEHDLELNHMKQGSTVPVIVSGTGMSK